MSSLSSGTHPFSLNLPTFPSSSSSPLHCHTHNQSGTLKGSRGKVSVFWDLDNKPPKSSPYLAALHLLQLAAQFGDVADTIACANRHAFRHIPRWVQAGVSCATSPPSTPSALKHSSSLSCTCAVCSFTCATPAALKKHCRLSHRQEWRNIGSKGFLNGGYGLQMELFRAGFTVHLVNRSPQAADRALKRQIKHSVHNGVQCICLVSDDTDFAEILRTARSKSALTVVVGDTAALKQFADFWFPWHDVARGKGDANACLQGYKGSQTHMGRETEKTETGSKNEGPLLCEIYPSLYSEEEPGDGIFLS